MLEVATVIIYSGILCSAGRRVLSMCSSVAQSWKREKKFLLELSMGIRHGVYLPAGSHLTPLQPKCYILAKQTCFPMGHAGSHFSRRGKSTLMQSQDAKLVLQHRHCKNSPHVSAHGLGWWLGHLATEPMEAEPCPPCSGSSPPRQGAHM